MNGVLKIRINHSDIVQFSIVIAKAEDPICGRFLRADTGKEKMWSLHQLKGDYGKCGSRQTGSFKEVWRRLQAVEVYGRCHAPFQTSRWAYARGKQGQTSEEERKQTIVHVRWLRTAEYKTLRGGDFLWGQQTSTLGHLTRARVRGAEVNITCWRWRRRRRSCLDAALGSAAMTGHRNFSLKGGESLQEHSKQKIKLGRKIGGL